jgi:hypothetical protein
MTASYGTVRKGLLEKLIEGVANALRLHRVTNDSDHEGDRAGVLGGGALRSPLAVVGQGNQLGNKIRRSGQDVLRERRLGDWRSRPLATVIEDPSFEVRSGLGR